MTIQELIAKTKTDNKLSSRALAKRLGIAESTLRWLMSGKRQPGGKVLSAFAHEFPEHLDDIMPLFLRRDAH